MGGSPSTTTTVSSNQYDTEKAETVKLMNSFLMSNIQSGLTGQKTALDDTNSQNIVNQLRQKAGRYNVSPGTQQFQQAQQKVEENFTYPNSDMMSLAMSLYGASQPSSGIGSSTSDTYNPVGNVPSLWRSLFTA